MFVFKNISKDVFILAIGQALTSTVVSLLTSISSLSGVYLAPNLSFSTLPVSATVLGTLLMIYPASVLMGRLGRRGGFMLKASFGILGGATASLSLFVNSFALLVLGTFALGAFSAFGQYYRFAAIEAAETSEERVSAISTVMGAGVVGGIVGPFLGAQFSSVWKNTPYAGGFIALVVVCILLALSQLWLSSDLGRLKSTVSKSAAPVSWVFGASFYKACVLCAVGFSAMTLVMNATPISLEMCGLGMQVSSIVLQIHFTMMYLPSFINPWLIQRFGVRGLVALGLLVGTVGCILSVLTEQTFMMYALELALSGIAWSFIFNGATLLFANTYAVEHKVKAQGLNSLIVYGSNILASLGSGVLMVQAGWGMVNLVCFPILLLGGLLLWFFSEKNG